VHIGIDVGGTKIELAIFDQDLNQTDSWREKTPTHDYDRFVNTIINMVAAAEQQYGSKMSVVVGLPGMVGRNGVTTCPNIPCVSGRNTVAEIEAGLKRPVGVGNDARNFALSEANGGAGDGFRRVLGIILGSGLGGGLCIDGNVYRGANNIAAEWGHMLLPATLQRRYDLPLRKCGCGATGCIERYFSGPGFAWLYEHMTGRPFYVADATDVMPGMDDDTRKVFEAYIDGLATCLSQLLIYYDPDVIVVGGGVSKAPEILTRLPGAFPNLPYAGKTIPELRPAEFGDSSGVRGAAMIGRQMD
jgi:N-acetylglucosamine kinase